MNISLNNILNILRNKRTDSTRIRMRKMRQLPYSSETLAGNLRIPWAIAINSNGTLYFTERGGTLRVIRNGILQREPIITLQPPFISEGEGGLMGIALDPDFPKNRYIYIMYTYRENNRFFNRVVRLVENNNRATVDKIILDRIPGGQIHNGGRIKIGPDRKLYITTGDTGNPQLAQDGTSLAGKILRINLDGSIPSDNPFRNSPVYSLGHRNPQGLAWNSNGLLYSSEHGQTAHDEINLIKPGSNYGWPLVQGDEVSNAILTERPLIHSGETTWAPSGIAFITEGPWQGRLAIANLRGAQLLVLSLNEDGTIVTQVESFLSNTYGRLREVVQGADGVIYISTSNRDGRGNPSPGDDRILRIVPQ